MTEAPNSAVKNSQEGMARVPLVTVPLPCKSRDISRESHVCLTGETDAGDDRWRTRLGFVVAVAHIAFALEDLSISSLPKVSQAHGRVPPCLLCNTAGLKLLGSCWL